VCAPLRACLVHKLANIVTQKWRCASIDSAATR
jgi:hypothetical protein